MLPKSAKAHAPQPYSNSKLMVYAQGHMGVQWLIKPLQFHRYLYGVKQKRGLVSANHLLDLLARHREAGFRPNQRNVRSKTGCNGFDGRVVTFVDDSSAWHHQH